MSSRQELRFSIVVAVYNRLDEVRELLSSFEELDYNSNNFEIVFVDDGSTDNLDLFINKYKASTTLNIEYLRQNNKGPGPARNYGMSKAQGEYFIFLDSDCTVPGHWLQSISNALDHFGYDAFGGPDTFLPSFSPVLKAINYSMTSLIGTGGTRGKSKSIGKFYPRSFNMGLHKSIFKNIGGMNDLRHGQDMDFSARIYKAGYKVGLIPEAYVYHKRRTSLAKFFRQIFNWGVARVNLGIAHPMLLKPVHFLPSVILIIAVSMVLTGLITGLLWLWILPLIGYFVVCIFAFIESFLIYKEVQPAFLSVITLTIQICAYGLGMLWAWPQVALGKEAMGFVKNYYGKQGVSR